MIESITCRICEHNLKMDTDDPLHFINWIDAVGRSVPVCSDECKSIYLGQTLLAVRANKARHRKNYLSNVAILTAILDAYPKDPHTGDIIVPIEQDEVNSLLYKVQNLIEKD